MQKRSRPEIFPMMDRRILVSVMAAIIILVMYVPFLNKAVHIDDGNFIVSSKELKHTLDMSHPPFIMIFLRLTSAFTGYRDVLMHAAYLIFPVILVASLMLLALEIRAPAIPAVLFIAGNVSLLPVAHNLMADVPMVSLWVFAAYCLISGVKRQHSGRIALSFIIMAIAATISYQTLLLLPVFIVYASEKRMDMKSLMVFIFPFIFIFLIILYITVKYRFPLAGILSEINSYAPIRFLMKGVSIPINAGAATLFIIPLLLRDIFSARSYALLAMISLVVAVVSAGIISYPLWGSLWLILLSFSGTFSLLSACKIALYEIEDRRLGLFFFFWITIVFLYNFVVMTFASLRYIMPAIVAIIFVILIRKKESKLMLACAVLTAFLGLAVAYGDYIFASSYRDFVSEVKNRAGNAAERVWYIGDWGMNYYMGQNGFRPLLPDSNEPKKGDLLIEANIPKFVDPSFKLMQRIRLIDVVEINSWYPLRLMGLHVNSGYYMNIYGYYPFVVSNKYVERFGIFEVVK